MGGDFSSQFVGIRQSELMPKFETGFFNINDLFANAQLNWMTLWPAMAVLLGILFGTFLLRKLLRKIRGEDDD